MRRRIAFAVLAGLITLALTRWPVAALAAVSAVMFLPKLTATRAARRRTAKLEGLEQWTRRLSDMLTASRGLEDALAVSARTAPAAIAGPVTALARRLSARVGTEDALRAFAAEIDDPAGDRIAAALIIATGQRGGAVHGVLSALAEILARDVAARREIEAERAQHRTTLRWIVAFVGRVHGLRDPEPLVLGALRHGGRPGRPGPGRAALRGRARLAAPARHAARPRRGSSRPGAAGLTGGTPSQGAPPRRVEAGR